jgi:hypothetical protein
MDLKIGFSRAQPPSRGLVEVTADHFALTHHTPRSTSLGLPFRPLPTSQFSPRTPRIEARECPYLPN